MAYYRIDDNTDRTSIEERVVSDERARVASISDVWQWVAEREQFPVGPRLIARARGRHGPGAMNGAHGFGPADITTGELLCGGRFEARELWGNEGDDSSAVYLDVFKSYVEGGQ